MNPEQPSNPQTPPSQPGGWAPLPQQPQTPVVPSAFDSQPAPTSAQALGQSYLNEISTKEPVRVHKFAMMGLIGGVLVLILVILMIMMNSGGPNLSTQAKFINGRITTLKTIVGDQQKHLEDNTVSSTNATLSSVLTTISTDFTTTMKERKITLTSSSSTTEKTYATTLTKKFEDAYQRGTLDRTYVPQIIYELSILRSKLVALKNSSSSKSIDTFCTSAIDGLDGITETFKKFSSTS